MMRRTVLCFAFAMFAAQAQIAVYTLDSAGMQTVVEGLADLGTSAAGDVLDTRFRLRNIGTANVILQTLRASGAGFTIQNDPSKPYIMVPGSNVDFRVRFMPAAFGSFSAMLVVNNQTYLLRANSPAGVTILTEDGTTLQSTSLVAFGRVENLLSATRTFILRNGNTSPLTVRSVTVSGTFFEQPTGVQLPVELAPGDSASFQVRFAPTRAGVFTGLLIVDSRTIPLDAVALDPPFPEARLTLESATLTSGKQVKLGIDLAAPSPVGGTGTLTVALRPNVAGVEDASVHFLANGTRTLTVSVTKGEEVARVNNQSDIFFQTGTTAGELTLQLKLGFQDVRVPITIASTKVQVDSAKVQRTTTGFDLMAEAFDNTRTATHAIFTFHDRSGAVLPVGPMRIPLADAFAAWWRQSGLGGAFVFRASFPVAGDASQLGAVEVEFENSLGRSSATRLSF